MNICFIANVNSIHARRWILPLIERGYQVYVVSYRKQPPDMPGVAEFIDLTQSPDWGKLRFLQWGLWLRKYLARIQPDILHAHQIPSAGWMGSVANYHPFLVSGWGSDILVEPDKSFFRKLLVKFVLGRTDHLTVPSQAMYEKALTLGYPQDQLSLIPWGVETDVFERNSQQRIAERAQLGLRQDQKVIFFPRRISPMCNLDILLESFREILVKHRNVKLILLRFQPHATYLKKVEQQIQEYGLTDHIIWLPEQNTPVAMAALYRAADVMVSIPSSEGYGFSVYEAMACGTPTVITDLPVFEAELVHQKETLKVPVRDVQATQRAIEAILWDEEQQGTIVGNGLQVIADKSVANRIRLVDDLYQHIVAQRK